MQYQPVWGDVPTWVQAIGSIIALFVAIWISWRSDKRARKLVQDERDRVATIARNSLLNTFKRVKWGFETKSDTVDKYAFQATIRDLPNLRHALCADLIDSALDRRLELQQLDAKDAIVLNDAFDIFFHYKEQVDSFVSYLQSQRDVSTYYVNPNPQMRPAIDLVKQICVKAIAQLSDGRAGA